MPQPFIFRTRIRFIDTDASGRIHYTAMFRYFESAEIEFMRTLGILYDAKQKFGLPRVHAECDFSLALGHDDLIQIELTVAKVGNSSIRFEFRTLKDGELAAKGAVVVACMDRETQRAVRLPDEIRAKLLTGGSSVEAAG
jgi:acyl-CoA thioester hydrolase